MADALTKINKAALTLPSVDSVNILRDPPSSIHTRKKERVEFGDVSGEYLRADFDRISDALSLYAHGVNPMVSIEYGNAGPASRTSSINAEQGRQASIPYKVARDGAFYPPMFEPWEDLLPLSRQPRPFTAVQPRPGIDNGNYYNVSNSQARVDKEPIRGAVHPSTAFNIGLSPHQYQDNPVLDKLTQSVLKGMTKSEGKVVAQGLPVTSGLGTVLNTVAVTDMATQNVQNYIQDRPIGEMMTNMGFPLEVSQDIHNIQQTNKESLTNRHIKEKKWMTYQAPAGGGMLLVDERDRQDFRNDFLDNPSTAPILDNRPLVSAFTLPTRPNTHNDWFSDPTFKLPKRLEIGEFMNKGTMPTYAR